MFKLVSNVGEWHTLFVSPNAPSSLRRFLPENVSYDKGAINVDASRRFTVERLFMSHDSIRPKVILLICEPSIAINIANRFRSELSEPLLKILDGQKVSDSVTERRHVTEYCDQLSKLVEKEADERHARMARTSTTSSLARNLAIAALAFAILLPSLTYWIGSKSRTSNPDSQAIQQVESLREKLADSAIEISSLKLGLQSVQENLQPSPDIAKMLERIRKLEVAITDNLNRIETLERNVKNDFNGNRTTQITETKNKTIYRTLSNDGSKSSGQRRIAVSDDFGTSVDEVTVEPLNKNDKWKFDLLEAKVVKTNQVMVNYQWSGENYESIEIKIKVTYRE